MSLLIQALLNGVAEGAFLAMAALGVTLVFGVARFPNVAHGDFLTLGAYGAFFCVSLLHLPLALSVVGGVAFAIATGLLAYTLIFRPIGDRPVTALLASIGLSIFIRGAIVFVASGKQRSFDLPLWHAWRIAGVRILPIDVYISAASLLTILLVHLLLQNTRIGLEMRAVSDNPVLARTGGIRPERVSRAVWSVALGVAGLAGIFMGARTAISPELGWSFLLPAFAAAVLGGLGSPYGAILAGMLLGIVQNVATLWISDTYKVTISFVVLIAVLLVRPNGLTGRTEVAR